MRHAVRSTALVVFAMLALVAAACTTTPPTGDTTKPVLSLPADIAAVATGPAGVAVSFTATAVDNVSGSVPVTCNPASGSVFAVGVTTVNCSASDAAGNTAVGTFTVTVTLSDTTPPVLFLPADLTAIDPGPSGVAVSYTVTATDNVDGTVPVTCVPPSGSVFPIGVTTVDCSATDAAGNTASGSFTVTVVDTTAPVLSLANIEAEATGPTGATVSYTTSAEDTVDGARPVNCVAPSGSVFPLGTTTVLCVATDLAGNTAAGTFTVTVADSAPPVMELPGDITAEAPDPSGAVVWFSAFATDVVSGAAEVACDPVAGSLFPIGATTVNCSATDAAGNTANGSFTVTVSRKYQAVTAGDNHTCAKVSGAHVKCWGSNRYGQLGNNSTTNSSVPVDVSGLTSGVMAVAAGDYFTCALIGDGRVGGVKCWGSNQDGQLGNNSTTNSSVPVDVSGLTSGVLSVNGGVNHACAVTTGRGVKCWGFNQYGQLGNNSTTNSSVPVDVSGLSSGVLSVNGGGDHTCAVTSGGGVKCWGFSRNGQLGNGTVGVPPYAVPTPVDVSGLSSGVAAVSAGGLHTCALTSLGGIKCWGFNFYGQFGNNSTMSSVEPVDALGP